MRSTYLLSSCAGNFQQCLNTLFLFIVKIVTRGFIDLCFQFMILSYFRIISRLGTHFLQKLRMPSSILSKMILFTNELLIVFVLRRYVYFINDLCCHSCKLFLFITNLWSCTTAVYERDVDSQKCLTMIKLTKLAEFNEQVFLKRRRKKSRPHCSSTDSCQENVVTIEFQGFFH